MAPLRAYVGMAADVASYRVSLYSVEFRGLVRVQAVLELAGATMKTIEINGLKLRVEDGLEVVITGKTVTIRAEADTVSKHDIVTHPLEWPPQRANWISLPQTPQDVVVTYYAGATVLPS